MQTQKKLESGQILLITLLVFAVGLTVALGLIGRTTVDTSISSQVEESGRAFGAAEAGIEAALKSRTGVANQVVAPGVTYNVQVSSLGGGSGVFVFPQITAKGQSDTIWLAGHNSSGVLVETPVYTSPTIDVCWGGGTPIPAIGVSIIYKESSDGSFRVLKGAYDPSVARRSGGGGNQFAAPTASSGGCGPDTQTVYRQTIDFASLNPSVAPASDVLLMLRVKPLFSDAQIAVRPAASGVLPAQGNRIESSGMTGSGITRKIVVNEQYKAASGLFDYVIFSQGDFAHQ